jgi:hypothetical protein
MIGIYDEYLERVFGMSIQAEGITSDGMAPDEPYELFTLNDAMNTTVGGGEPADSIAETPTDTSTDTSVDTSTDSAVETPLETATDTPMDTPAEPPTETSTDTPMEPPTELSDNISEEACEPVYPAEPLVSLGSIIGAARRQFRAVAQFNVEFPKVAADGALVHIKTTDGVPLAQTVMVFTGVEIHGDEVLVAVKFRGINVITAESHAV